MSAGNEADDVTILFVDDSASDRTRAVGLLSSERPNWNVLAEESAADGLEVLERRSVSLVITDLFMPGMSGEEFLLKVKEFFPSVPVILVTSYGSDQIAARSLELGAVNYVPKRRLADDLVTAIDEVLRSAQEATMASTVLAHMVRSRTLFRIESSLEQIRSLLLLIRERLQILQELSNEQVRHVTDAVREALINACFHGNLSVNSTPLEHTRDEYMQLGESRRKSLELPDRTIEVELTQEPGTVCFSVTDDGDGFDTSVVSQLTGTPSADFANGNGFRIMQQNMDVIEFNSSGNRIALTKRLRTGRTA